MYILLKLAGFLLKIIPRKAGYYLFETASMAMLFFSGKRKHTLNRNLANVLGPGNTGPDAVKAVYKNYGRYYFELFRSREELMKDTDISLFDSARKFINETLDKYGGLIICSLHLANWDHGGNFISTLFPKKVCVVVETLSPGVFKWFRETREKWGMEVIEVHDVKSMLRALKEKKILVLLFDRDLEKNGFKLDFFGKKAYIPRGPASLALKAKVPVLFSVIPRLKENKYKFRPYQVQPVLNLDTRARTEENETDLTRRIIKQMEEAISRDPEQWCMLQEVWVDETAGCGPQTRA